MVGLQLIGRIGEKGQIVIPKPIRDQFNIKQDTEIFFEVENENIVLKKKRSGLDVFEDFVSAVKKKKIFPKQVDWDKEYYSQFD